MERIKVRNCEECPYDDCITQGYWGGVPSDKKIYENCPLKKGAFDIIYNHKIYIYTDN